jgi:hypothetical protein
MFCKLGGNILNSFAFKGLNLLLGGLSSDGGDLAVGARFELNCLFLDGGSLAGDAVAFLFLGGVIVAGGCGTIPWLPVLDDFAGALLASCVKGMGCFSLP